MIGDAQALLCGGASHVGRRREANEDSLIVAPEIGLLAVADGMGGHAAGEVASRIVTDTLREFIGGASSGLIDEPDASTGRSLSNDARRLSAAIRLANDRIFQSIAAREELRGMGTTVVAALVSPGKLTLANVGDSRAYLLRGGALRQMSADHSWVQEQIDLGLLSAAEAHRHPFRNIVTRALGSRQDIDADLREEGLLPGDILLLCSDGLNSMVDDDAIRRILSACGDNPTAACDQLVDCANAAGGEDNITVIVARVA